MTSVQCSSPTRVFPLDPIFSSGGLRVTPPSTLAVLCRYRESTKEPQWTHRAPKKPDRSTTQFRIGVESQQTNAGTVSGWCATSGDLGGSTSRKRRDPGGARQRTTYHRPSAKTSSAACALACTAFHHEFSTVTGLAEDITRPQLWTHFQTSYTQLFPKDAARANRISHC
jgi:hypothetical protein